MPVRPACSHGRAGVLPGGGYRLLDGSVLFWDETWRRGRRSRARKRESGRCARFAPAFVNRVRHNCVCRLSATRLKQYGSGSMPPPRGRVYPGWMARKRVRPGQRCHLVYPEKHMQSSPRTPSERVEDRERSIRATDTHSRESAHVRPEVRCLCRAPEHGRASAGRPAPPMSIRAF